MRVRSAEATLPAVTPKQSAWLEEKRVNDLTRLMRRVVAGESEAFGTSDPVPLMEHITVRVAPQTQAVRLVCTACERVQDIRPSLRHSRKARAVSAFTLEHATCAPSP